VPAEHLIHQDFAVRHFGVVQVYPDGAVGRQQVADQYESLAHHPEPHGMLERVVVVLERLAGVERRVYVDELHFAAVFGGVFG
jgi:hypothetical protein